MPPMRTRTPLALAGLLLAGVTLVACSGMVSGKEDADRAVEAFHRDFNAGSYDAIWDAASESLQQAISRQDFGAMLAAVRRKLGDFTGSTTRSWNVNSHNLTTFVSLVVESRYATAKAATTGTATETFLFVVKDGRATLSGYNISSLDLILR